MTIEPIGRASVALYLTPADLSRRGLPTTPGSLTLEQALALTREACGQAGIPLEGAVEIEAYPECRGVLVFAHVRPAGPDWFTFDGLEPLVRAALELRTTPVDAGLWWWEGRYWLSLPPGASAAGTVCREFGRPRQDLPSLPARLEKEGQVIFPHHALWHLCRHFLRLHLENL